MPLPGKFTTLLLALLLSPLSVAETTEPPTIVYLRPQSSYDIRDQYYVELLELALDETRDTHGDFVLEPAPFIMLQGRAVRSLAENHYLDVLWTMTTPEREQELLPIRIPLVRGLLGYRALIIRKQDAARFAALQTLDELATLRAVQGHDWPDTTILRANGLSVTTSSNHAAMFDMLRLGRVDYFPRGMNEAWTELGQLRDPNLMIYDSILLHYTAPIYFFVSRDNPRLAARIETGLRRALADGSFQAFFRRHPATHEALQRLKQGHWRIFDLQNPLLPAATPLQDHTLWYRPVGAQHADTQAVALAGPAG